MIWRKVSRVIWENELGNQIVKYRMAGEWVYLCYAGGYRDYCDYKSKPSLLMAKVFFETVNLNKQYSIANNCNV